MAICVSFTGLDFTGPGPIILAVAKLSYFSPFVLAVALSPVAVSHAATVEGLEIRGFGSTGIQAANSDYSIPDSGIDGRNVEYSRFTKAGINVRSSPVADFSVAAQVVAGLKAAAFVPEITWGFVDYEATSGLHIRAGRLLPPIWLFSQQVDVGFSLPWIEAPREVYGLNPLRSLNGASFFGRHRVGPGILEYDIIGGGGESYTDQSTQRGAESSTLVRIHDAIGGAVAYSWADILKLRAGYYHARTEIDVYSSEPIGNNAYADLHIPFDATIGRFYSGGMDLTLGSWSLVGEWAKRDLKGTAIPQAEAAYLSMAYELGIWTPRLTYSRLYKYTGTMRPHPGLSAGITSLQDGQTTMTAGVSAHLAEPLIAKFELSHTSYNFNDPTTDFGFWAGRAALNFVF